jgi:hypothetical protein
MHFSVKWSPNCDEGILMFHITTPPFGHPLQASLLFLFARHSKSKLFLCTRSFVKSKIEGEFFLELLGN